MSTVIWRRITLFTVAVAGMSHFARAQNNLNNLNGFNNSNSMNKVDNSNASINSVPAGDSPENILNSNELSPQNENTPPSTSNNLQNENFGGLDNELNNSQFNNTNMANDFEKKPLTPPADLLPANATPAQPESPANATPAQPESPASATELKLENVINESAQSRPEQKTKSRTEKLRDRLELTRKIAENIPPLRPGEGPLEYTVQPGDTLWDISDQLLDDPLWWPRLWVLNPEISNPDQIEPGLKLVFYPGSADKAPELIISDEADPIGNPKVELTTLQTFNLDIQRGLVQSGEIIDPASLPADQHFLSVGEPTLNATYLFRLPGFFGDSNINQVGEVLSSPNSPLIAGQGQHFLARFDNPPKPGERFIALRESPILSHLQAVHPENNLYSHSGLVGVVRSTADGFATLVAEENSAHIAPFDILIPANKSLYVPIDRNSLGRPNQAPALVVGTEGGHYQSAGPGSAVFLQGVNGDNPFRIGDDVELYMPLGGFVGFADEVMPREKVAIARIVDVTADSAVGVVMKASREVTTGASTFETTGSP